MTKKIKDATYNNSNLIEKKFNLLLFLRENDLLANLFLIERKFMIVVLLPRHPIIALPIFIIPPPPSMHKNLIEMAPKKL